MTTTRRPLRRLPSRRLRLLRTIHRLRLLPAEEPPPPPPPPAAAEITGDTPAERAISGIKALGLPADTTITVFTEDLSILGPEVTKDAFEAQSGIKLDIQKSPFGEYASKILADAATKAGTFDVVLVETNRLGDLSNAGYLVDVTEWVEKYDPDIEDFIFPISSTASQYNGRYVGLPPTATCSSSTTARTCWRTRPSRPRSPRSTAVNSRCR